MAGAKRIWAIDINPAKFPIAKVPSLQPSLSDPLQDFGATDFFNPRDHPGKKVQQVLVELTDGGFDYTVEAVGDPELMSAALESCHKGWV